MRIIPIVGMFAALMCTCVAQKHKDQKPFPSEVVIGRDSFIDVGPPFNYYDLTFLRNDGEKTDVERISLTPPSDACYPRAEVRVFHLSLGENLSHALEGVNPCMIPEKELKAELKRRNKGLVFSGMNVTIQTECMGRPRVIRADILDRDIFDEHPNTPQYTAWSRALFDKLDRATGDRPWDKPIFPFVGATSSSGPSTQSPALQAIAGGKFDEIFGKDSDRPSALYRMALNPPRKPFIELTSSEPVRPTVYVDPIYPPIAKAARVHGTVEFHLTVNGDGSANEVAIDAGPKLLQLGLNDAIAKWKFSENDSGKVVHGSLRFGLNCAAESK